MIQDIQPELFQNHYEHLKPQSGDRVLYFLENKLLARYDEDGCKVIYPKWEEFTAVSEIVYAFTLSNERYFLMMETEKIPDGYEWYAIQELRGLVQQNNTGIFIAFTAWHLWKWYQSSRFCGCCGAKTDFDTAERAMVCLKCGYKIYPRINPAVIVGVTNGDRIVLTKYNVGYGHNALIAGFTEIGETMEETVQREVMEEVGLKVKNIRYYKSQPWGIAADILIGYYCEVDGDDTIHRDNNELKYAEWVRREDIILQPDNLSLTNEMMMMCKNGLQPVSSRD